MHEMTERGEAQSDVSLRAGGSGAPGARVVDTARLTCSDYPQTIWVVPTTRCNTRCRICLHFVSDFGQDMPAEIFEKIAGQVLRKVSRVNLVGLGEPLMARHFAKLMDVCLDCGARVFFITNGKAFTQPLMEKCLRSGAEVMISLDGLSQETFGYIRPQLKLEQVLNRFREIKRLRAGHEGSTFKLLSNTVVMRRNLTELPALVRFLVDNGVDSISLTDLIPHVVEGHDPELAAETPHNHPEELGRAFREALDCAEAAGTRIACPPYYHQLAFPGRPQGAAQTEARPEVRPVEVTSRDYIFPQRCYMPWTHANFLETGEVTLCCGSGRVLGSLATADFDEIWNGPQYRNARRLIHSNNPVASCRYCSMHGGNSGGDASFFRHFIKENHLSDLRTGTDEVVVTAAPAGAAGAAGAEEPGIILRGLGSLDVHAAGAAFLLLTIEPDRGRCHGEILVDGGQAVCFDTSDQYVLVALPEKTGPRVRLDICVRLVADDSPASLRVVKLSRLGHAFRAVSALDTRRAVVLGEHGQLIAALHERLARWAAAQPEGRRCFGVFGIHDIGEVVAQGAQSAGLRFSGYFDHFPGHFREHCIRAVATIDPEETQALLVTSPYGTKNIVQLLSPVLAGRGIALLSV